MGRDINILEGFPQSDQSGEFFPGLTNRKQTLLGEPLFNITFGVGALACTARTLPGKKRIPRLNASVCLLRYISLHIDICVTYPNLLWFARDQSEKEQKWQNSDEQVIGQRPSSRRNTGEGKENTRMASTGLTLKSGGTSLQNMLSQCHCFSTWHSLCTDRWGEASGSEKE